MKGKLLIVEGPDACGKTTFAKHLAEHIGGVYWHMTCTRLLAPAMLDYQLNAVANAQANMEAGLNVVFDRHWISEACYGPVLRPDTMIDVTRIRQEVSKLDPIYLFCLDSARGEEGAKRASDRHKRHLDLAHPYDEETYLRIYRNYETLYEQMTADVAFMARMVVRPFDERIIEQQAVDRFNRTFCTGIAAKFNLHPMGA